MKINYRQFKRWIAALDSGDYKQGKGALQTKAGYCCLGVACDVLIPKEKLKYEDGELYGAVPDEQPKAPSQK